MASKLLLVFVSCLAFISTGWANPMPKDRDAMMAEMRKHLGDHPIKKLAHVRDSGHKKPAGVPMKVWEHLPHEHTDGNPPVPPPVVDLPVELPLEPPVVDIPAELPEAPVDVPVVSDSVVEHPGSMLTEVEKIPGVPHLQEKAIHELMEGATEQEKEYIKRAMGKLLKDKGHLFDEAKLFGEKIKRLLHKMNHVDVVVSDGQVENPEEPADSPVTVSQ